MIHSYDTKNFMSTKNLLKIKNNLFDIDINFYFNIIIHKISTLLYT